MLNESVTSAQCEKTKYLNINGKALNWQKTKFNQKNNNAPNFVILERTNLEIPYTEPWFEQWRETFLTVQFPADHEFTRHFLSCLIVLSSADPNPLESANQLTKQIQMMQNVTPPKLPKWFSTEVLNCYVMLHDACQGDISK